MDIKCLKRVIVTSTMFIFVIFVSAFMFYLLNKYDNKYTSKGPQSVGGILMLDEHDLNQNPIVWLVMDWEIYRDKLLSPEDFVNNPMPPDELVFIGQYGGFEGKHGTDKKPHGSATYRLNISLPPEVRSYTLELPEIYSAYTLYINGVAMHQMGNPGQDKYVPYTGVHLVTVQASQRIEIIIAVSDYSHFYSGMVYPPAFGLSNNVKIFINTRLVLKVVGCSVAVCVGIIYLLVGLFSYINRIKNNMGSLPVLYFFLCISFSVNNGHSVIKTLFWGGNFFYIIEIFSFCMVLLLISLILGRLVNVTNLGTKFFISFSFFVCTCSVIFPLLMKNNLTIMLVYSHLIGIYSWLCGLYLTVVSIVGVYRDKINSRFMLMGVAVFDTSLIMDRIFPQFEPIMFGWFTEIGGWVLVSFIGIALAVDIVNQLRLQEAIEYKAQTVYKMLEVQKSYYPEILAREQQTREIRHDIRHHFLVMQEFVNSKNIDGLSNYLNKSLPNTIDPMPAFYCDHYIINTLLRMYSGLAKKQQVTFNVEASSIPSTLYIDDADICVIFSNILENALEACVDLPNDKKAVTVHIGHRHNRIIIVVQNTFDGNTNIKNNRFISRKSNGREGIGIESIKSVSNRYGGSTRFYVSENLFHSEVVLPDRKV